MIMGENEDDVMFGNAPKTRTGFKINAGKKAFLVLSEKLYKDKAEAVLRELSCNAVDVHCENGKAHISFNVTLPTSIFPWFVIRDFGTGLSAEQIDEIFTVYFASTKDNSNDSIGGFGLGCKSPFAYSESGGGFTVKSYQNGFCTVYNMYMDNGEPFSTPMSTTPTDEPDGLEILVPIPEHEHARWKVLARKVFRAFDRCKPNVTNMDASSINEFPDQDNFFHADDFGQSGEVYAVIGGVVYPIPRRIISDSMVFRYGGRPSYIKCPIGTVDIAPSREELSLNKEGEEYLIKRMEEFSADFAKTVMAEFDGITDHREAVIKAVKYNSYVMNSISGLEIGGISIQKLIKTYTDMSKMAGYTVYALRNGSLRAHVSKTGYSWRSSNIDAKEVFGINRRHVHVLINDTGEGIANMVKAYQHNINEWIPIVVINKTGQFSKRQYAVYGELFKNICNKFSANERTILKFSEMVDIRKAYTAHKRKTTAPRDAKPNVYRHYLDETGTRQYDCLCLSAKEIRDLEGLAVISYAGTCDRLSAKPSNNMNRRAIDEIFSFGATEVYAIDNGKRGPVLKSKLECAFKWVYDTIMSRMGNFNVMDGECPYVDGDDYHIAIRLKKMGMFDIEMTSKFDYENDNYLSEASDWMDKNDSYYDEFHKHTKEIHEKNVEYSERFKAKLDDIKINNALLFAVASSDIELTQEIMQDVQTFRAR